MQTPKNETLVAHQSFPELAEAAYSRRDRLIGSIALSASVEICHSEEVNPTTLIANVQEAALGDEQALFRVRRCVSTDVAERLFKAGHITFVPLERTSKGLEQSGVSMQSIHKNTLEHMPLNDVMRARTGTELGNIFLFEEMDDAGIFETHDAVVLSATPTDPKTRKDYNFFTDTDSLSIQYLKKTGGNSFVMETAMMAGKTSPDASRHDLSAIKELLLEAGMEHAYFDENDALSFVILVQKTPDSGVHNIVEKLDTIIGGTFFGENKPKRDYAAYREVCKNRERQFDGMVNRITNQLLAEAGSFRRPYEVVERLDRLSDLHCIEKAANDRSIDAGVFGAESALHIERARLALEYGDAYSADMYMAFARSTSKSSSCPFVKRDSDDTGTERSSKSESDDADCEFTSKKCPECGAKNVKTLVRKIDSTHKRISGSCGCKKVVG